MQTQTIDDFYYQINFLEQTKGNLISVRQAYIEGELGELTHDYVISTELPNVNTQYINSFYSAFLESGDNEEIIIDEYSSLLAIANQCPAAGGQSVYRARALLALINDSLEYDDYLTCLQSGIYREAILENKNLGIEIIPNPATDLIKVRLLNKSRGICNLRIINSFGAAILSIDLNCEIPEHVVNIEKLQAGVYFVHINFNESYNRTEKLIIIR